MILAQVSKINTDSGQSLLPPLRNLRIISGLGILLECYTFLRDKRAGRVSVEVMVTLSQVAGWNMKS